MPGVKMMPFRMNYYCSGKILPRCSLVLDGSHKSDIFIDSKVSSKQSSSTISSKMLDNPRKYDYTVESWKGPAHLRPTVGNPTLHLFVLPPNNNIGLSRADDHKGRLCRQDGRR